MDEDINVEKSNRKYSHLTARVTKQKEDEVLIKNDN